MSKLHPAVPGIEIVLEGPACHTWVHDMAWTEQAVPKAMQPEVKDGHHPLATRLSWEFPRPDVAGADTGDVLAIAFDMLRRQGPPRIADVLDAETTTITVTVHGREVYGR